MTETGEDSTSGSTIGGCLGVVPTARDLEENEDGIGLPGSCAGLSRGSTGNVSDLSPLVWGLVSATLGVCCEIGDVGFGDMALGWLLSNLMRTGFFVGMGVGPMSATTAVPWATAESGVSPSSEFTVEDLLDFSWKRPKRERARVTVSLYIRRRWRRAVVRVRGRP